jgi:hypothetical protein
MLPSASVTTSAIPNLNFEAQSLQLSLSARYFADLRLKFIVTNKSPRPSYTAVG